MQAGEGCDDGNTTPGDGCDASRIVEVCGNGVVHTGEQCDDGNLVSGDGCTASCVLEFCGDGTVQAGIGEQCDDGNMASGDGCDASCLFEVCGNGVVQAGEQCDDGNAIDDDACANDCTINVVTNLIVNGDFSAGTSPWVHYTNGGGSFSVVGGEARVSFTSNGFNVQLYQHDIAAESNQDYTLTFPARHAVPNQQIIARFARHTAPYTYYGLSQRVRLSTTMETYTLQFTTTSDVITDGRLMFLLQDPDPDGSFFYVDDVMLRPASGCGNGAIDSGEVCDGSNLGGETCSRQGFDSGTLGCNPTCSGFVTTGRAICGDGVAGGAEQCDGIDLNGQTCVSQGLDGGALGCNLATCTFDTSSCVNFVCGDGVTDPGEECDDGNVANGDGCDANCVTEVCGNGVVQSGEQCDDGNTVSGEGCSSSCQTEFCGDGRCNPVSASSATTATPRTATAAIRTASTRSVATVSCSRARSATTAMPSTTTAAPTTARSTSRRTWWSTATSRAARALGPLHQRGGVVRGRGRRGPGVVHLERKQRSALPRGIAADSNQDYVVTFRARHTAPNQRITVRFARYTSPYTYYGLSQRVTLSTSMQTYTLEFTTTSDVITDGRLMFLLSDADPNGASSYVDDVVLQPAGPQTCGNGAVDPGEGDGSNLGGQICASQGFDGGTLACNATCTGFVTTGCFGCGDGVINGSEVCDGANLGGETCASQGFDAGNLSCNATCDAFVTSSCSTCGDGVVGPGESCDDGNTTPGDGCSATCQIEGGGANLLQNGDFSGGTSPWRFATNASNQSFSVVGGEAFIDVNSVGSSVQLYQSDVALQPNTSYRLTFRGRNPNGRDVRVRMIKHTAGYDEYGLDQVVNLGSSMQTFVLNFTTPGGPLFEARLQLWLAPCDRTGADWYFDDLVLEQQ